MDDPALRKFLGISGHGSNKCCPLCTTESRPAGKQMQSFVWEAVTVTDLRNAIRSDADYRAGLLENLHTFSL
jgi:hypothetical protein